MADAAESSAMENKAQQDMMSMIAGDCGPESQAMDGHGAQALAAARAHLAAVAEELATIQRQCDDAFASGAGGIPPEVTEARERERERELEKQRQSESQIASLVQSKQDLERERRHLDVDLECANAKADRLALEKDELVTAHARMGEELQAMRKQLELTRLNQQHRDMEQRKLLDEGLGPLPDSPLGTNSEKLPPSMDMELADQAGLAPKPANNMSKHQAVAALRTTRADLVEERKRRERLERRVQKDKERLERCVAVAEAQRGEIAMWQKRCYEAEMCAEECLGRLQDSMAQSESLKYALQAPPGTKGSNKTSSEPGSSRLATPPFGGKGANGPMSPSLLRQQSAPTRLPTVGNAAPKRG